MTRPLHIIKSTPATARIEAMTRDELTDLLQSIPNVSVPAVFRATEDALKRAALQYLRMGQLTEAAVLATKKGKP